MKLLGFLRLKGNLRVVTGLHIGGSSAGISIGATDSPVIKVNDRPYIPGSSLKGKIRSLLEISRDLKIDSKLGRHECKSSDKPCDVCVVFGRAAERKGDEGPTRIIFRDCYINDELSDEMAKKNGYTEIKMENAINRITSRVEGALRDAERVLPGTVFDVEVIYRVYDEDAGSKSLKDIGKLEDLPDPLKRRFNMVLEAMRILENDYLGGKGTRGYGKVKFENIEIDIIPLEFFQRGEGVKVLFNGALEEAVIK